MKRASGKPRAPKPSGKKVNRPAGRLTGNQRPQQAGIYNSGTGGMSPGVGMS